jgi:leucyl/phenylalanyl-tRNA--protein transferase
MGAAPTPKDDRTPPQDREALFRETPFEMIERVALGIAWAFKTNGLGGLLPYWRRWLVERVAPQTTLPDPEQPFDGDARVGLVHDLSVPTLIAAYRRGLFTAGHFGTLVWRSPPARCVLFFDELHMAKRLRRLMRQGRYTVTFDRAFEEVMKACAGRRKGRWHVTWITPRIMRAYAALFDAGYVHSFEVWNADGALVGGGYGVALGRIFFTESQFSLEDNTSKLGFSVLNWHLAQWGYVLNDGKEPTPTILDMGFRSIPRAEFLHILAANAGAGGKSGPWSVEADVKAIAEWQPGKALSAAE